MTALHPCVAGLDGRLVLASGSPRRRELLAQLGAPFDVQAPDVDESHCPGESPTDLVQRLALDKARAVSTDRSDAVVVAADTVVDVDGEVLGKPHTDDEAQRMLHLLSGRCHLVHTGVTVAAAGEVRTELVTTGVEFVALDDVLVDWYVSTGEPHDKAGGYAIQGHGGVFVASIDGSASNVVGLPLAELSALLTAVSR